MGRKAIRSRFLHILYSIGTSDVQRIQTIKKLYEKFKWILLSADRSFLKYTFIDDTKLCEHIHSWLTVPSIFKWIEIKSFFKKHYIAITVTFAQ